MSRIILVHGIAQEFESADQLEANWIPAIAGGLRAAGFSELADATVDKTISVKMAYYGEIFRPKEAQGPTQGDNLITDADEALVRAWLERLSKSTDARMAEEATFALSQIDKAGLQSQGTGAIIGAAIRNLSRIPWAASLTMGFTSAFIYRALGQVGSYLTEVDLRGRIQARVRKLIDKDTSIIIGHSLGSVVAYDVCRQMDRELPLLITIGSPLGIKAVVYDRLENQPPRFPSMVKHWLNVVDRDDFVAAEVNLDPLFTSEVGTSSKIVTKIIKNGALPHDAKPYLNSAPVAVQIGETLKLSV